MATPCSYRPSSSTRSWLHLKKPLAIIVGLLLVLSPLVTHVGLVAPSDTKFLINTSRNVAIGEPIELRLMLVNARNVGGFETVLLFDTEIVQFQGFEYRSSDLKQPGGDLEPLATVEAPYGAAFGVVSCLSPNCDASNKPGKGKGPNGNVQLMRVSLVAHEPGQVEIKVGATKVVDVDGNPLSVDVQERSLTIRVGAPNEGPAYPAPTNPWTLPSSNSSALDSLDLTGSGDVTRDDLVEVAIEWSLAREKSAPCGEHLDLSRDINNDGCVDIADLKLVAASLAADGAAPEAQQMAAMSTGDDQVLTFQSTSNLTFTVNSTGDEPSAVIGNGVCQTAVGTCTLRAAIQEANNYPGANTINFNIPGSGVHTIRLTERLPTMWGGNLTINGYSQPGASPNTDPLISNANIRIQIEGAGENQFPGFTITSSNNRIQGLAVYRLNRPFWIQRSGASQNELVGNFIGTNAAGTYGSSFTPADQAHGIHMELGAANNRIGGTSPAQRNIISGNARHGVGLWHGGTNNNVIVNNILGLNPSGTQRLMNRIHGIDMNYGASNNRVGGTGPGERNVSSGNNNSGIDVSHGSHTTGNQIVGNFLGTNVTGTGAASFTRNNNFGIRILDGVTENVFSDNVIGNNGQAGIDIQDSHTVGNLITRNRIGIGVNGNPIPNPIGIRIAGNEVQIGPDNIIAYNTNEGVRVITDSAKNNTITRNSIHDNGGRGIRVDFPDVNPPVLDSATTQEVRGTACGNCVIEVFIADRTQSGARGQGKTFIGSATSQSNGSFVVAVSGVAGGQHVTATATNSSGSTSEYSVNRAVTGSGTSVAAPSNLSATAVSTSQINLSWTDNADNEDSYVLERSTNSNFSSVTAIQLPANTTSYQDTGRSPDTTYYYRVKAMAGSTSSAYSNTASATTLAEEQPPPPPPPWATTFELPGKIEAENYKEGGQNVGYFDTTAGNTGGAYRTDDVDIQTCTDPASGSPCYNVGWIDQGEWLAYDVIVTETGQYTFTFRVATPNNNRLLRVEMNGTNVTGSVQLPNTGGWQNWTDVTTGPTELPEGQYELRLVFENASFNINYFEANKADDIPPPPPPPWAITFELPGKIEAENYKEGGQNVGYFDTTAGNTGGAYRDDDVDIQTCTDPASGSPCYNVGWIAQGEWLAFDVIVTETREYTFTFRVATIHNNRRLRVEMNGTNVTGSVQVPNTGGWQNWTDVTTGPIVLPAGEYELRLIFETPSFNINYFEVQ